MDGCNTSLTSDALLDISNQPNDQRIAFVGHPYGDKGSILAASLEWHDQRRQAHICKLNCPASECGEKPEVHGVFRELCLNRPGVLDNIHDIRSRRLHIGDTSARQTTDRGLGYPPLPARRSD